MIRTINNLFQFFGKELKKLMVIIFKIFRNIIKMSIRLIVDGVPIVCIYQSFAHYLMLLLGADETVVDFLGYLQRTAVEKLDRSVVLIGMFEKYARIVLRITEVYLKIDWADASQDHTKFLAWLDEVFIPLLERLKCAIPEIDQLVDECLSEKCGKTLGALLQELRRRCHHSTDRSEPAVAA
jgi:hypothetical protein